MKRLLTVALCAGLTGWLMGQTISGTVLDQNGEGLIGASVYWLDSEDGVVTDEMGAYSIERLGTHLVASFVGFRADTIAVDGQSEITFTLNEASVISDVVVKARKDGITISNLTPIKTENITTTELKKAACCDLAGCFETQSSVEAQVTNVITNAKELRISGLSGVYNQVLIDGFSMINGLSYTYGLTSIPGTMVQNIFVSKGANSVLQGYESISGQINVITKDPDLENPLFLNVFLNGMGEKQLNGDVSFRVGEWSNILALHTTLPASNRDRDTDGFLDVPKLQRFSISDKWKYSHDSEWGWSSEISLRYLQEQRTGGQLAFDPTDDLGSTSVYGQHVELQQPEITAKTIFRWDDIHSVTWFASGYYQNQNSWFGTVQYDAQQTTVNNTLQYEYRYNEESDNNLKAGISHRYHDLSEDIAFSDNTLGRTYDGQYDRDESVIGLFAENTLFFGKFNWLLGLRGDYHDDFGFQFAPRTLLKYEITPELVVRANIGTGWRTVNLFSENINLLVSSRDVVFAEELRPEKATNAGINMTQRVATDDLSGYISADFYHTRFSNQIFPDYDSDPTKAIIANYEGKSVSNSLQLEAGFKIMNTLDLKAGYTFTDVYRENSEGVKSQLPFNAQHKVLGVISYRPMSNKWQLDVNAHWYGKQRLPNTDSNPTEYQRPDFSKAFGLINSQFTYNFSDKASVYAGVENIFDFRQERPIISWENPFGKYFDTSFIWGPTQGRMLYLGARYEIGKE